MTDKELEFWLKMSGSLIALVIGAYAESKIRYKDSAWIILFAGVVGYVLYPVMILFGIFMGIIFWWRNASFFMDWILDLVGTTKENVLKDEPPSQEERMEAEIEEARRQASTWGLTEEEIEEQVDWIRRKYG